MKKKRLTIVVVLVIGLLFGSLSTYLYGRFVVIPKVVSLTLDIIDKNLSDIDTSNNDWEDVGEYEILRVNEDRRILIPKRDVNFYAGDDMDGLIDSAATHYIFRY